MVGTQVSTSFRALIASAALFIAPLTSFAAAPATTTLTPASAPASWSGNALGGSSPDGEATCVEGVNCDSFTLTLSGTAADWSGKNVRVSATWLLPATDYDLYIHKDSITGPEVARSAEGTNTLESAVIDPSRAGTGTFVVHLVYFAALAADQYKGSATIETKPAEPPPPPVSSATPPGYDNFAAPDGVGTSAGEPSIGVNWFTGNTMFLASLETLRVSFDESVKPAIPSWVNKSAINTSITTFDPILYTDQRTGRTFVSQLLPTKLSLMSYTDDDGEHWTPSQGSGINSGVDHQTIAAGPFKPGILGRGPLGSYPNAVYYASQDIGLAEIALSQDGGLTFGPAVPMYNISQCDGIHGHIKVAPDGTVYVPNKSCYGGQALVVSEDNGLSWTVRPVPNTTAGESDPSVGVATDGTIYFGYGNGDGTAHVAVSHDRGLTWVNDRNVGFSAGINNTVFPATVAGDPDRAAMFFVGTTKSGAGGTGTDMTFNGTWYGYVATTYDGGNSWVTVSATGTDPVQRGVICTMGTTCPSGTRNLLDFNDLTIDKKGRPVAAFADGCITDACRAGNDRSGASSVPDGVVDSYDNDGSERATILRQSTGATLFAAYDPPKAPSNLSALANKGKVTLTWTDNASNEERFSIERSTAADSGFAELATVTANSITFADNSTVKKNTYYYRVRAANANGTSSYSNVARVYVK
jgi:hypothetical protein